MTHPLLAVPYSPFTGDPRRNTYILDQLVKHPGWLATPILDDWERRKAYARILTYLDHRVWEVWRGGDFVGILTLTQIHPQLDAVLHFVFFDGNLIGKRRFLRRFLATCFDPNDLGLHRLTLHIPEYAKTLIHFARRSLGFKYEGEAHAKAHELTGQVKADKPELWMAKHGSRREQAHWYNGTWHDVIVLRLLASEYAEAGM